MKGKYWYEFFVYYCPICGREDVYKERNYGPKPENYSWDWIPTWDGCNAL